MRKNLLALSIAAMVGGLSGVANASVTVDTLGGGRVFLNTQPIGNLAAPAKKPATGTTSRAVAQAPIFAATDLTSTSTGIGHILFVPYFTAQEGNATLLNLVNADQKNGKAVKLRFRGAANSDDLFDISIYLSPGDVWTAKVSKDASGVAKLETEDNTCTLPSAAQIKESGGKFSTNRVLDSLVTETLEGYVEILNMADVPPTRTFADTTNKNHGTVNPLFTATKHVNGVAPCTQAVMDQQATPLSADAANVNEPATRGYSWPTGGLMANWTVVNVGTKASYSGQAVALRATPSTVIDEQGAANLVFSPQTTERVVIESVRTLTADPLLTNDIVRAASYDFPDLSTPYVLNSTTPSAQASELGRALAVQSISNEYVTSPAANFSTDWVFSMPTRRYAVALNYEKKEIVTNDLVNQHFTRANVSLNKAKTRICVDAGQLIAFDREEQSRTSFVISPDDILKFCGETSVLSFNGKPSLLGAVLSANNIPTKFVDGWLRITTPGLADGGLPLVGFAVMKAVGPDGGNFGGTWAHRTNRFNNQPF